MANHKRLRCVKKVRPTLHGGWCRDTTRAKTRSLPIWANSALTTRPNRAFRISPEGEGSPTYRKTSRSAHSCCPFGRNFEAGASPLHAVDRYVTRSAPRYQAFWPPVGAPYLPAIAFPLARFAGDGAEVSQGVYWRSEEFLYIRYRINLQQRNRISMIGLDHG